MVTREHDDAGVVYGMRWALSLACGDPHASVFEPPEGTRWLCQRELAVACLLFHLRVGGFNFGE